MATKREDDRWSKHPPTTRCLYIIIALLICLIIAFIILAIHYSRPKEVQPLCNTRQCLQSAYDTLFLLDPYKDPCKDFYDFACGDFKTYNSLPVGLDTWSAKDENRANIKKAIKGELTDKPKSSESQAVSKLRMVYEKCNGIANFDAGATKNFVNYLKAHSFPEWTTPTESISTNQADLEDLIAALQVHSVPALIAVKVVRANDMQSHALLISPGMLTTQPNISLDNPDVVNAYSHLITKAFTSLKVENPEVEAVKILEMEKQLADFAKSCPKIKNQMHITETSLQKMDASSNIKWSKVFRQVFETLGVQERSTTIKIKVECDSFINKLSSYVNTQPQRIRRYLAWRFFHGMLPYIDARSRHMAEVFRLQVNPPSVEGAEIPSAADACIESVNRWMPEAISELYLRSELEKGMVEKVQELVEDIKKTFLKVIPKQDWLDDRSKTQLEEKVKKMKVNLAYPQGFFDSGYLDKEYSKINVPDDADFIQIAMDLMKHENFKKFSNLFQNKPEPEWAFSPLTMASATDYYRNTISIPIGLIEEPFYLNDRPAYLNFGGVGFLVAQELFRGFTMKGLRYDAEGSEKLSMPPSTMDKLTTKAKCFEEQYSKYKLEEDDEETLNGTLTLDTNLADNAAFYNTFQAYMEYEKMKGVESLVPGLNYTNHQLVFIQMAQSNCQIYNYGGWRVLMTSPIGPGKLRTNGMASNSEAFSKTFQCSSSSPMNPSKKCGIWTM